MRRIFGILALNACAHRLQLCVLSARSRLCGEGERGHARRNVDQPHDELEASAKAARSGRGSDQALNDLHNQLHAFDNTLCCVEKAVREQPTYALAVTHSKELWAIFKRAWKFKDDQPQREQHLDLFASEVKELRETLQSLK
ncbi:hypothetical protein [Nitrospira calida]|jgi:hypothetical protein